MTISALVRVRWLVSVMLIVGAALFAIGASAERHNHNDHDGAPAAVATTGEGTLAAEGSEGAEAAEAAGKATSEVGESADEKVFGINLESTPLVVLAVIVSLILAVATWMSNHKLVLSVTAGFTAVFAVFDIAELVHQIDRSKAGLAMLAAIIAFIHAGTALLAVQRATTETAATA